MGKGKENTGNQNIAVYVRSRPLNAQERGSVSVVEVNSERREVLVRERTLEKPQKTFTFDRVFDQNASQVDIYKAVVSPLLEEVLTGFSCTVFAYGQTGTGKTFTMEGERSCNRDISWEEDPLSGIVPRAMHHLFETLREQALDYSLRVSFLELYNEELFDLLGPLDDASKLRLYEDPIRKGSVIVNGLEEVAVHSKDEVYAILERGSQKRQTAATLMNANSSRSHTVFSITVHIKDNNMEGEELMRTGKLNLVDLAGSENIGRSGAVEKRAREAGNINQSLLTLGRVITSLVERSPHIPYRESKLTRLLQDSLGGKTKTSIIATISPASVNIEETLSTLDYAHRAKNITNKPEANQKLTKKTLLKQYTEEIERLRRDLAAAREKNGIFLEPEMYYQLTTNVELKTDEIEQLVANITLLKDEYDKVNHLFNTTKSELQEKTSELNNTQATLSETQNYFQNTVQVLNRTAKDRDEQNHLVKSCVKTEKLLTEQASQLISVADVATSDITQLHSKIQRKQNIENNNELQFVKYQDLMHRNISNMKQQALEFGTHSTAFFKDLAVNSDQQLESRILEIKAISKQTDLLSENLRDDLASLEAIFKEHSEKHLEHSKNMVENSRIFKEELIINNAKVRLDQLIKLQKATLYQQAEFMKSIQKEVAVKINKQNDDAVAHVNDQMATLSAFQEDIDKTIQCLIEHIAETKRRIDIVQKHNHQLKNELKEILEENAREAALKMSKANALILACDEILQPTMDYINADLQATFETSTSVPLAVNRMKTTTEQSNNDYVENFKLSNQYFSSFIDNAFSNCESVNQSALKTVEELHQEIIKSINHTHEALETNQKRIENDSSDYLKSFTADISQQLSQTQILCNTVTKNVDSMVDLIHSQEVQCRSSNRKEKDEASAFYSEIEQYTQCSKQDIDEQALILENYSHNIQRDAPSGNTPIRRPFVYPRTLVATSPHERILNRYRSTMNSKYAVAIPLPEDSYDDMISEPSIASSVESQDSSFASTSSKSSSTDSFIRSDDDVKENQFHIPPFSDSTFKKPKLGNKIKPPRLVKKPLVSRNVDPS